METAFANIAHISRLNTLEVREWGRFPNDRMHSGGIHEGNPSDEPQCIPVIELGHLPRTCQLRVCVETPLELTCCIFPNMIVEGAWVAVRGARERKGSVI